MLKRRLGTQYLNLGQQQSRVCLGQEQTRFGMWPSHVKHNTKHTWRLAMVSVVNKCIWHAGMMRLQSISACQLGKARKEKARTKEGWPLLCRLLHHRLV